MQTNPSVGLSTKLSVGAAALLALVAALTAFLDGDHSSETITAIGGAVATLVGLTLSRGYQAGKLTEATTVGAAFDTPEPEVLAGDVLSGRTAEPLEVHAAQERQTYANLEAQGAAKPSEEQIQENNWA